MTNFEMYKDDLIKIKGSFAVDKNSKKIAGCDTTDGVKSCINCSDCIFDAGDCFESDKIEWLYKEYEPPVLSDDELELIKILSKINGKEYRYITRNGNRIFLFSDKPPIDKYGVRFTDKCNYLIIDDRKDAKNLFSNIKYEDGLYDIENKCFIKVQ